MNSPLNQSKPDQTNDSSPSAARQRDWAQYIQSAETVVVKVGTRALTNELGYLDPERMRNLSDQLVALRRQRRVVLVSSGAVAAGMSTLGYTKRPADLAELQAVAAIGQTKLIQAYDHEFRRHQFDGASTPQPFHAAQVLLGADDLQNRVGYLNVRNTLLRLMDYAHVIPVINENDTVSVEELQTTFGDNDQLAALVTNLLRANLLIMLSTVAGLNDHQGTRLSLVPQIDERIRSYVCDQKTGLSKGGMASKLKAAQLCTSCGEAVMIADGRQPDILTRIIRDGDDLGTLFLPQGKALSPLKRWIGFPARTRGKVVVDAGARGAIANHGSLLAVGMTSVEGEFQKGDVVSVLSVDATGQPQEFARGLTNYSAADLRRICGLKSSQIVAVLGHRPYEEVIHCDNMIVLGERAG
ncbi:MAG: glutamate 5-kinase [Planctomycetota bacterium]